MKHEKELLGADAAEVASAGSIVSDVASHAAPTPGPWKAGDAAWYRGRRPDDTESGKRPITAGDYGVVANVYGKANAYLIASAPEMKEALLLVATHPNGGCSAQTLQAVRAALAKSEGQ